MNPRKARGVSWELVGVLAIVAVVVIGGLAWVTSPAGRGELVPPQHRTLDPALDLVAGVTDDGRPFLGRPEAPVSYYAFEDFQCPFCRSFAAKGFPRIVREYIATGKARVIWVSLGYDGDESVAAASAALCAGEQGRFWDMHDWLYANQAAIPNRGGFSRERLVQIAGRVGLSVPELVTCMDSPQVAARIDANDAFARRNSVGVTPVFLVGERVIEGGDAQSLAAALDAATGE
jgi:protein-disulfide isomerase